MPDTPIVSVPYLLTYLLTYYPCNAAACVRNAAVVAATRGRDTQREGHRCAVPTHVQRHHGSQAAHRGRNRQRSGVLLSTRILTNAHQQATFLIDLNSLFNFNLFIKQKDRSATYIDMHEIHVETL